MTSHLLETTGLGVAFGSTQVVENVDLVIEAGQVLGVVGESGSGKSVTALAMMRLLDRDASVSGVVRLEGRDLLALSGEEMRAVRGREIGMIFQEPMTSLNPVLTVGFQVAEVLEEHLRRTRREAMREAVGILEMVGIPAAAERASSYPHELSGGMRQRVMIAMAMAVKPKLLIADEPTTALDVTIQAQILALMRDLKERFGMGVVLISHDMGVVASMADRVAVMYAGQIVEEGHSSRLFREPRHPYTRALLDAMPSVDHKRESLAAIPGTIPNPEAYPAACRFHPRCPKVFDRCSVEAPELDGLGPARERSRCWL